MQRDKRMEMLLLGILLLQGAVSILLYPRLPERVPSHWNLHGQVDGWMKPSAAILAWSGISLGVYALFWFIPALDPKRKITATQKAYQGLRLGSQVFFFLLFGIAMAAALGIPLSMDRLVPALISLLIVVIGNYLGKIRPNYFMGIRTPWTLEDPVVWQRTHRLGGILWMLAGLVGLAGSWAGGTTATLMLFVPLMAATLFVVIYSWFVFRQLHAQDPNHQQ